MTFPDFLTYLRTPNGIAIALGFALSFLVEWWPTWNDLQPKAKRLLFLAFNLAIPLLAALAAGAAGYEPWSFETLIWPALVAGFLSFSSGTIAHLRKL